MTQMDVPHVRIVMATCNGARFLAAQLQSFVDQDHTNWSLVVGDDGSTDDTRAILADFAARHPQHRVDIVDGPGQGAAANFLTQVAQAVRAGDWLAFSDQDDVWMPHKITRALHQMSQHTHPDDIAMYAARTQLTNADLEPQRMSPRHIRPTGFRNALVQNILAGNTIVLNPKAAGLLARCVPAAVQARVPFHDWWTYLLITAAGGRVVLDDDPVLFYRQHAGNMLGHNARLAGRASRAAMVLNLTYADWISANLTALTACDMRLSPEARYQLKAFQRARAAHSAKARLHGLRDAGVYRQSSFGDRMLALLAWSNRL